MSNDEKPAPQGFWNVILAILALLISLASFLGTSGKTDRDESNALERRLCRLEALNNMGECKR